LKTTQWARNIVEMKDLELHNFIRKILPFTIYRDFSKHWLGISRFVRPTCSKHILPLPILYTEWVPMQALAVVGGLINRFSHCTFILLSARTVIHILYDYWDIILASKVNKWLFMKIKVSKQPSWYIGSNGVIYNDFISRYV